MLVCDIRLPFPDAATAKIVGSILLVDKILGAQKAVSFHEEGSVLEIKISASTARNLRTAIGSVLEQTKLALRTLRAFSL